MFGGLAFVVNGHMCCVVLNKDLVLRVAREDYEKAQALRNGPGMLVKNDPVRKDR
jgi:hypothetical protein